MSTHEHRWEKCVCGEYLSEGAASRAEGTEWLVDDLTAKVTRLGEINDELFRRLQECHEGAAPRAEGLDAAIRAVTEYAWGLHLAGTPNEAEAIALIENLRHLSRPSDERVPESEEPR